MAERAAPDPDGHEPSTEDEGDVLEGRAYEGIQCTVSVTFFSDCLRHLHDLVPVVGLF